jgi:hypothetical protein
MRRACKKGGIQVQAICVMFSAMLDQEGLARPPGAAVGESEGARLPLLAATGQALDSRTNFFHHKTKV